MRLRHSVNFLSSMKFLTTYVYDRNGNLLTSRRFAARVTYDANGAIVAHPGLADQVRSYTYTLRDAVASATDIDGTVTTFAYDTAGRLRTSTRAVGTSEASTTVPRYDAHGNVVALLSGEGAAVLAATPMPKQRRSGASTRCITPTTRPGGAPA